MYQVHDKPLSVLVPVFAASKIDLLTLHRKPGLAMAHFSATNMVMSICIDVDTKVLIMACILIFACSKNRNLPLLPNSPEMD